MTTPTYEGYGDGWVTDPADPRMPALWAGAADYDAEELGFPLHVAQLQCILFAPALEAGDPVPEHWVAAQVLQTRALVASGHTGSGDQAGSYGETVTVFPMDWTVKNLLRPRRPVPYFGGRRP